MKKIILIIIPLLLITLTQAQQQIKIDDLSRHIGDSVTVCAKVYRGIYLENSKGTPTLLNLGGDYPNAPLTVLTWGENRSSFKEAPETFFKNKNICVTGKIKLYKGKPEIIVYDEKQIIAN